jgi:UDP-N-acetylmuramate dehydrogenase
MYDLLVQALGRERVKYDEPLAKHTYFKLGGPADLFFEALTSDDLVMTIQSAINFKVPYYVLGGGSNILVTDKGFRGLVIKNKSGRIQLKGFTGSASKGHFDLKEVIVQSDSGVPTNKLIRYTVDEGLEGLEDFLGLPGSVGGAVYNNSHHLSELIGVHVVEVIVIDEQGSLKKYQHDDMKFEYDYSILHKTHETILMVSFQLKRGDKVALWEKATAAVKRRSSTQPLGLPSSGCIFRNIPLADKMRLGVPTSSSGYLIDKAGLKGLRVGGAYVSDIHANFIVNDGTATTRDVLQLVDQVKAAIKEKYGVTLEMEVFLVGEK